MREPGICVGQKIERAVLLAAVAIAVCLCWAAVGRTQDGTRTQTAPPAQQAAVQPPTQAGTESGIAIFEGHCTSCHGNPNVDRAPSPAAIREMTPERIYAALTTGPMKAQGDLLTEDQRRMTATFLSGRPLGTLTEGDAKDMPNHCASNPPMSDPSKSPEWNGWGVDPENTRFQGAKGAGLTASEVPHLKLKWAFGYPDGLSAYSQPTIASGRVFVGTDTGYIYSLSAATGCVYWSYQTKGAVRSTVTVAPVKGQGAAKYAVYFGDFHSNAYAIDAQTGKELWVTKADDHFISRITAGLKVYDGVVVVPESSSEEFQASQLDYPCCTLRGSVVGIDANTGEKLWKTYLVGESKPTRVNSRGVQQYAPAGVGVWNTPTVDTKLGAVYFGTADSATEPAADTSDAVMALDIKTGKTLWVYQTVKGDAFLGGCNGATRTDNCPSVNGPDLDIGNSPILRTLPSGKRVLVFGTKDGKVFALDPDNGGALVWQSKAAPAPEGPDAARGRTGGIVWGGAADQQNVYYGLSSGGMSAIDLATGNLVWHKTFEKPGVRVSNAGAATAIPGIAFVAGSDGKLHAVSTADGSEVWSYDTVQKYDTVNKVPAKGGGISSIGPVIAGGMVFVGSGYAVTGNNYGNVLLAFAPQ